MRKLLFGCVAVIGLFFSYCFLHKPQIKEKQPLSYSEVVVDVKEDSIFPHTRYVVKVKRTETIETYYWLHTDEEMDIGKHLEK